MSFGLKDEHRHIWPVRTICAMLGISASGYYAWRGRAESRRSVENRALLDDTRVRHGSRTDGDHMAHRRLEHARDPSCLDRPGMTRHGHQTPAPGTPVRHRSRTHGDAMAHSTIQSAAFNTRLTSIAKPLPPRK